MDSPVHYLCKNDVVISKEESEIQNDFQSFLFW